MWITQNGTLKLKQILTNLTEGKEGESWEERGGGCKIEESGIAQACTTEQNREQWAGQGTMDRTGNNDSTDRDKKDLMGVYRCHNHNTQGRGWLPNLIKIKDFIYYNRIEEAFV